MLDSTMGASDRPPEITAPYSRCICPKPFTYQGFVSVDGVKAIFVTNDNADFNPEYKVRRYPYQCLGGDPEQERRAFETAMQKLRKLAQCKGAGENCEAVVDQILRDTVLKALRLKTLRRVMDGKVTLVQDGKLLPLTTSMYDYRGEHHATLARQIAEKWPGAIILNDLPEEEAYTVYWGVRLKSQEVATTAPG